MIVCALCLKYTQKRAENVCTNKQSDRYEEYQRNTHSIRNYCFASLLFSIDSLAQLCCFISFVFVSILCSFVHLSPASSHFVCTLNLVCRSVFDDANQKKTSILSKFYSIHSKLLLFKFIVHYIVCMFANTKPTTINHHLVWQRGRDMIHHRRVKQ